MAKLSELIKCLEDGGQIKYTSNTGLKYPWYSLDTADIRHVMDYSQEYEMREAPPKPKEVTFRAWMVKEDIDEYRCLSSWEVDLRPNVRDRHNTEVEITIKEVQGE